MAISVTVNGKTAHGGFTTVYGVIDPNGTSTGDVDTGLSQCYHFHITNGTSAVEGNAAVVNETFPCAGNAVTVVLNGTINVSYFLAVGR